MARTMSTEEIIRAVGEAMEETMRMEDYPERLLPYTPAELKFLREFVGRAIIRVLEQVEA